MEIQKHGHRLYQHGHWSYWVCSSCHSSNQSFITYNNCITGKLSSDYAKRGNLPVNAGINDFLQQWMSCRATRTLIDITAQCLQCLMHSDTESCIKALLDTSVLHSPHFDWVVAHVGSCFPNTVITRVLSCGLKDFFTMDHEHNVKNPKLNSVVGILGHLAGSHFQDIRTALLDLFKVKLSSIDACYST